MHAFLGSVLPRCISSVHGNWIVDLETQFCDGECVICDKHEPPIWEYSPFYCMVL